jgi:amidohydrolase
MTWQTQIKSAVDATFDAMVTLRRHLHQNPEVSGEEHQTSLHLYQLLDANGFALRLGPEGRGVIADLAAATSRPCIALRADIDALRIQDEKQVAYASRCAGIMHACGHDAHTATVFGALRAVQSLSQQGLLPCVPRVRAIFQPAEETCLGACEMIRAGAINGVQAILACHMDPTRAVGKIGLRPGVLTANCEELTIEIKGHGGHAARPHEARDPIIAAAQLINLLYVYVPRSTDSQDAVVITIGRIDGGHTSNVIPESVRLWGTLRTLDRVVRGQTIQQVIDLAASVGTATNTDIDVEFGVGAESVVNDPGLTELLRAAITTLFGPGHIDEIPRPSMGSEDFAFYGAHVPACMMRLGCASDRAGGALLHTPQFDIDEQAMHVGAQIMAAAAIRWLIEQTEKDGFSVEVDAG